MSKLSLYQQIAEEIRQDILRQNFLPGDRLPSVREMATRWHCTIGTIQKAYNSLAQQGLIISRPGQGTHVTGSPRLDQADSVRRVALVHKAEAFLLEAFAAGYSPADAEQAVRLGLDRWRALHRQLTTWPQNILHFAGSHDPALAFITSHFNRVAPDYSPQLAFCGSLGGLIALAAGEADLAGAHLWDEESNSYNIPFVRRLLPGRRTALVTLAHRRLGLITAPGNPLDLTGLADLARPEVRFINRQSGAGTRVWLDTQLRRVGLVPTQITGYHTEALTHSELAQAIIEGQADVGLGVESAALAYGLTFIHLTSEQYDLVIPAENWPRVPVQSLVFWLDTDQAKQDIQTLGGYDVSRTGHVQWVQ